MRKLVSRSMVVAATLGPIAALSVGLSATASAQPLNCQNGQWWDPVSNSCRAPLVPLNCAPGQYWNPASNLCRPLGSV